MTFANEEIIETIRMVTVERLDIRTVTLGVSLLDCAHPDGAAAAERVYSKVMRAATGLIPAADAVAAEYGIPIVNRRVSVTPVAWVAAAGGWGSTAALALLTDAVKKGGAMASASVGGLSGAFIPVSEDAAMDAAAASGALSVEFGWLLGRGTVIDVNRTSPARLIARGGRIPAPLHSLRN